ncbi:Bax inhibitor-1/YccA family protein [Cellulomonas chengniuliangii]|uniref:Bax inhibitor-1/YccA family protein n=1 Tax=Cellulomonas chengniuliangii TaxID=2968084 RepID=A0ABY5L342_9CELL|nr:Bax inhibitor-1/YccA family protein [Cellulomonas chengniuliangii]MCC2307096.1 Bax inhibitor-1/YccA family protein [Cellulomonas chengniuliangii]MCC2316479.1 Bax inhibitor-1/YccA family protein [Cellulomonas chengniuliangii]UUI76106.1 Bax inhibitor-1/YccA family protein [Cellulomonas chengniuliangii]
MSNPVFSNSDIFGDPRERAKARKGAGTATAPSPYGQQAAYGNAPVDAASLNQLYEAPAATTVQTGRMTYDDVIMKTGGLLALLVVVGAATWMIAPGLFFVGAIVGLVLGLVNAFKKNPSPALIVAYTVAEGVFLGGISAIYESRYDGVVGQAVLATLAVFGAALFLFRSGKVRVTPKFTRFLIVAMVGYLAYSLINVVLMLVGVGGGEFGPLRSGALGIGVGLLAVGLASMSLIMDFDSIKRGVEQGVPAKFAWSAAFGLIVTLVWLYLELLRLLSILRGD